MGSETTSASLLSRVRDPADHAAWREFDARYGVLILRYCRGRGLRLADAEDVRQMVMVKLAKALPAFHYSPQTGRFRNFLGRIVRNESIRHLSRPNVGHPMVDTDETIAPLAAGGQSADERWEREWRHHHLRLAMLNVRASYDPRSVEIFECLLAGQTVGQTATAFDVTTDAVHKIKQRIRVRLRELIAAQIREEDEPDG